ncbi:hypothetical protein [Leptolyngbya sp. FACHB-261]|uniref:hypothetical protein n=1 Tax=Leptolyngbya sp. FACHB-261 TaxID=2692806 RepID=UPI001687A291|nr:hypothetical protein [Leptolyngbya sp. FACHB-261]MBD2103999.1 hypothetical protein [Leptolyngbya sp. FACHB-261]
MNTSTELPKQAELTKKSTKATELATKATQAAEHDFTGFWEAFLLGLQGEELPVDMWGLFSLDGWQRGWKAREELH